MNKIICPHCNKEIIIDEEDYKSLLSTIRDDVFNEELNRSIETVKKENKKDNEINIASLENKLEKAVNEKLLIIKELESKIINFESEKELAVNTQKSKSVDEMNNKDKLISELKLKLEEASREKQTTLDIFKAESNEKITKLEYEKANSVNELKQQLENAKNDKILALKEEEIKSTKILSEKSQEINEMKLKFDSAIKDRDEEIDRIKNSKAKLSTKLIGETLEKHCENEFNRVRAYGFENAYFEKDNDSTLGTKGDYIFRDYSPDGIEYVSIMFEMKNEDDESKTKHKNEDFYKKLDKDRKEKKCEYAVLVSLLEKDNELFNDGILDVSHKYEKMYVIRPQFFIQMISILRNASRNNIKYIREIEEYKIQNLDIVAFENNMLDFQNKFGKNYESASKAFDEAIKAIDKSIDDLVKAKEKLTTSNRQMRLANDKAQDLNIKKLANKSPSLLSKLSK